MKRGMLVLIGSLCALPLYAAQPEPTLSDYLDGLQKKLDHAAQRANQPSASGSAVMGLRGSKVDANASPLYWKTAAGAAPASIDELKRFREAIILARQNKKDEAISELQAFRVNYHKSVLIPDVEQTLQKLTAKPS